MDIFGGHSLVIFFEHISRWYLKDQSFFGTHLTSFFAGAVKRSCGNSRGKGGKP